MHDLIGKLGLKRALFVAIAAALVAAGSATVVALSLATRSAVKRHVVHGAEGEARAVAGAVAPALEAGRDAEVAAVLDRVWRDDAHAFIVVLRPDGTPAVERVAPGYEADLAAARAGAPAGPRVLAVAAGVGRAGARAGGKVVSGITREHAGADLRVFDGTILACVAGGVLAFAMAMHFLVSRVFLRPLDTMSAVARRVSDGDLCARAETAGEDEIGALAEALNRIGENLTVTLSRVQTVTGGVGTVIQRISQTGAAVSSGAGTVSARAVDTSSSMSEMIASLKGIADNVEVLAQSAEESSSSILEMAATNDEVAENIQALAASVEETTTALEQMTYSMKEVAKNIEELSATTEETSSSMNEMDVSISQVETNANETAKLSEQAQRDAESGAEALSRTLAGIDKIKESSKEAANVIEALGKKIAAIGNIVNVIDDVAEQTNLLALNAAILAAQSGEHGKGFAVVADEIKDLAERTGASTKEISELIRGVQESSRLAVQAMDRGVRNVEEGVRLGQDTETALKKIQESSHKSTQMVKAIARATIEQARGSKQVTMAINRIAETVQQIATATAEQARGSEQIMSSADKMKAITKHVERSAQEQARGSKQITRAIESISEMVHHLNRAQKEQTKGSEQVMTAVVQIKQVAEAQTHSARELEAAIVDLASQAEVLRGEVKRFKV
jgi:methyl-accepting chemotaxis protein